MFATVAKWAKRLGIVSVSSVAIGSSWLVIDPESRGQFQGELVLPLRRWWINRTYGDKKRTLLQYLPEAGTVLELGVGAGDNFSLFVPNRPMQYIGIERNGFAKSQLEEAAKEAYMPPMTLDLKLDQDEETALASVPTGSVDSVVCTFRLNEMQNLPGIMEHVHRTLRPGGRFYFVDRVRKSASDSVVATATAAAPATAPASITDKFWNSIKSVGNYMGVYRTYTHHDVKDAVLKSGFDQLFLNAWEPEPPTEAQEDNSQMVEFLDKASVIAGMAIKSWKPIPVQQVQPSESNDEEIDLNAGMMSFMKPLNINHDSDTLPPDE
jgi:SAM-dependent methyltransferase